MKAIRISNQKASKYVNDRIPFKASNLFATLEYGVYTVFSYGTHWILFLYKDGVWYENEDKYSVTTSKHRSQARPNADTLLRSHTEIHYIYQNY